MSIFLTQGTSFSLKTERTPEGEPETPSLLIFLGPGKRDRHESTGESDTGKTER